MSTIHLAHDSISVGRFFSVNFQRTIRIPDDGNDYPLPPGFGCFPLRAVSDYAARVPASWLETGGFFLPMYRHEALWLSFDAPYWHPVAVRVEAGGVDALTGEHNAGGLHAKPQNYMVAPDQPWLDGIKAGENIIRQFVAAPLGEGVTIEAQVTGTETQGGIRITVVEPKPGRFPNEAPVRAPSTEFDSSACYMVSEASTSYGLAAGGRMVQKIYPDPYGLDTWDASTAATIHVHLLDVRDWERITGETPPPSPIAVDVYKSLGLPWFALADHEYGDIAVSQVLAGVQPVQFNAKEELPLTQ